MAGLSVNAYLRYSAGGAFCPSYIIMEPIIMAARMSAAKFQGIIGKVVS